MSSSDALKALGHASSGSIGTAISAATLYPLDLVTTRLKAQQTLGNETHYDGIVDAFKYIVKHEGGVRALYKGMSADVAKSMIDSFLFFGFYNYIRNHGKQTPPSVLQELIQGAVAGACTKVLTTPISNVVARKQTSSSDEKIVAMLKEIYDESGVLGLWSGYSATLVLTMNPSITFFVNRRLAKRIIPALEEEDVPVAYVAFLLAAISKATATAITYPFQSGKTRLQVAAGSRAKGSLETKEHDRPKGLQQEPAKTSTIAARLKRLLSATIFGVIIRVLKEEGVRALYDGLRGELLKSFFSHGLTMFTKGVLHRLIIRLWLLHGSRLSQRSRTK